MQRNHSSVAFSIAAVPYLSGRPARPAEVSGGRAGRPDRGAPTAPAAREGSAVNHRLFSIKMSYDQLRLSNEVAMSTADEERRAEQAEEITQEIEELVREY